MTPTPTRSPLLDLNDLCSDNTVLIKGQTYALIPRMQLAPLTLRKLGRLAKRSEELTQRDEELTSEEEKELEALPDRICRIILDAPDDVQAGLTERERMRITEHYFHKPSFLARVPQPAASATNEPTPATTDAGTSSIGENSSLH